MFRPGGSIPGALRKLLQGDWRESQAVYKFATKGAGSLSIRGKELRNSAFSVCEGANLWAHWIHSFHMLLSCLGPILFPCSPCFLHFPSSSAITIRDGSICWITVWGALIHIWRPEIADGRDISCLLIWQEIIAEPKYWSWAIFPTCSCLREESSWKRQNQVSTFHLNP